jgi:hypothetical protein
MILNKIDHPAKNRRSCMVEVLRLWARIIPLDPGLHHDGK